MPKGVKLLVPSGQDASMALTDTARPRILSFSSVLGDLIVSLGLIARIANH